MLATLRRVALMTTFISGALSAPVLAQGDEPITIEEALQICAGVKRERDRLDCFEGLASAAKPREAGSSALSSQTDDASPTDPVVAGAGSLEDNVDTSDSDSAQSDESNFIKRPLQAGDPSQPSQKFVILPADEAKERIGPVKTPGQKRVAYTSVLRKAWMNGERRLFILLDTGEVYKQIDSIRPRTPKPGDEIELRPAKIGGWFVETRKGYRATRMSLINK